MPPYGLRRGVDAALALMAYLRVVEVVAVPSRARPIDDRRIVG